MRSGRIFFSKYSTPSAGPLSSARSIAAPKMASRTTIRREAIMESPEPSGTNLVAILLPPKYTQQARSLCRLNHDRAILHVPCSRMPFGAERCDGGRGRVVRILEQVDERGCPDVAPGSRRRRRVLR